jgi:hypothetical protein
LEPEIEFRERLEAMGVDLVGSRERARRAAAEVQQRQQRQQQLDDAAFERMNDREVCKN